MGAVHLRYSISDATSISYDAAHHRRRWSLAGLPAALPPLDLGHAALSLPLLGLYRTISGR
jgi:hypothetical protein